MSINSFVLGSNKYHHIENHIAIADYQNNMIEAAIRLRNENDLRIPKNLKDIETPNDFLDYQLFGVKPLNGRESITPIVLENNSGIKIEISEETDALKSLFVGFCASAPVKPVVKFSGFAKI